MFNRQNTFNYIVGCCNDCNNAGKDKERGQVPKIELLSCEIARRSTKRKGEENCEPVESLAASCKDGVYGKRSFTCEPHGKSDGERDSECSGSRLQRNTEVVGKIIGDERTDDTNKNDRKPVDRRNIFLCSKLKYEHDDQQRAHDDTGTI